MVARGWGFEAIVAEAIWRETNWDLCCSRSKDVVLVDDGKMAVVISISTAWKLLRSLKEEMI